MATQYVAPVSGTWAAKSSSPFGAARSGGRRLHAGNDLQVPNGSKAVAVIGGKVLYAGHNSGYQWNAVVLGDDGNAYRYATHGPLNVKLGQRVEQGAPVGTIARNHLHFEVIPSNSPALKSMVANPGRFVPTQWWPNGQPVTVDPAKFFGVEKGQKVAAGQAVGNPAASQAVAEVPQDPFGVAEYQRNLTDNEKQDIASLRPGTAGAAIDELQLMAQAPTGVPSVDALAYNEARAAASRPPVVAGQDQTDTLVGGVMPPTPPSRPQTNAGFPGQLDYVASGNAPAPRPRPDRLAPPTESMVRPDDYIAGRVSGLSPDTMNAGLYRSRADQMPVPPSRPEANTGFPGQLDYMSTGMLPNPRIAPPRSVDIPTPRLRPVETQTSPSLVVGPPPRPIGALPAATPERMSDAEYQAMKDELAALAAKQSGQPIPAPTPRADGLMPASERQSLIDELNALRVKQGTVEAGSTGGENFSPPPPGVSLPPPAYEPMVAGRPEFPGSYPAAVTPPSSTSMLGDWTNRTLLDDIGDWWNGGGTPAAAAAPTPFVKDQSRVPESSWFAGPDTSPRPEAADRAFLRPITYKYDTLQDSAGAGTIKGGTGRPTQEFPRPFAAWPNSPEQGMGITGDPYWVGNKSWNASPQIVGQPDNINQGFDVGDRSMSQGANPLEITIPVGAPPSTISMQSFNDRFGGPTMGTKPTGAPSSIALDEPIDIRPPAAGGPVVAPPSVVPQKPAPQQITSAPTQKQTAALGVLSTILGGPGRLFGGGGGGLFGGGSPFAQSSANAFQATGGGQHPSGQTYKTGTIGSTNWNAGQYDNSKGQTVTYATDPWQGGYMVNPGWV